MTEAGNSDCIMTQTKRKEVIPLLRSTAGEIWRSALTTNLQGEEDEEGLVATFLLFSLGTSFFFSLNLDFYPGISFR